MTDGDAHPSFVSPTSLCAFTLLCILEAYLNRSIIPASHWIQTKKNASQKILKEKETAKHLFLGSLALKIAGVGVLTLSISFENFPHYLLLCNLFTSFKLGLPTLSYMPTLYVDTQSPKDLKCSDRSETSSCKSRKKPMIPSIVTESLVNRKNIVISTMKA